MNRQNSTSSSTFCRARFNVPGRTSAQVSARGGGGSAVGGKTCATKEMRMRLGIRQRTFGNLWQKAVTLVELVLVMVILATGAAIAFPALRAGIENQEAKHALRTLRTIAQAVRTYELDHDCQFAPLVVNPCLTITPTTDVLRVLEDRGLLNRNEYAPGFEYLVWPNIEPWVIACRPDCNFSAANRRIIWLQVYRRPTGGKLVRSQDGVVIDNRGFLSSD